MDDCIEARRRARALRFLALCSCDCQDAEDDRRERESVSNMMPMGGGNLPLDRKVIGRKSEHNI